MVGHMDSLKLQLEEVSVVLGTKIVNATRFEQGLSHDVYMISTEAADTYTLRIPKDKTAASIAKTGTVLLTALKRGQPTLQVPSIIYESDQFSILQFLDGEPLKSWNNLDMSVHRRETLLEGIGKLLLDVWTAAAVADASPPNLCTYRAWLVNEADKGFRRSLARSDWGDPVHFLHRRTIIPQMLPEYDGTMIALKHGDLNVWNVLADGKGLTGVIDWDTAHTVPLAAAVQHPLFIADIPGWLNDGVPPDMTFEDDRVMLESIVHRLSTTSPSPIAKEVPALLRTSRERQFFEMSLRNKQINAEYTREKLVPSSINKTMALRNLAEFLESNPDLQKDPGIQQLETRLLCLPNAPTAESAN
ncbi:hypothetical protein B0T24DRAFT_677593 [Lasiosphaeria ovina]|uniref:Aminoglycoside phosphotransferase domain-containing protein n=1 Tax=Lasiosphaeria ovina TaxID=92902 RepID=A0AAE0NBN9_9PEZI|nr:hypothetical protein B0T24DRAFT_677593 [Lasiosphaeria ovina]